MKVAVTGGTGFVGCHTVAALSRAGHSVALLVRSKDRVAPALEAFGIASALILRNLLRGLAVVFPAGTWMVSDVRDVARLHARLVDARRYNRYFAPTTTVSVAEVFSILSELTGRSLPSLAAPEPLLRPGLLLGEAASRVLGVPLVWSAAAGWSVALRHRADDSRARQEFALEPTPLRDTIRDMVRWLVGAGHMPARLAGKLAA